MFKKTLCKTMTFSMGTRSNKTGDLEGVEDNLF